MPQGFWDRVAEKTGYDHSHINKKTIGDSGEAKFKEIVIGAAEGSEVLDVGCADGSFTIDIARYAEHVTGIDNSARMIEKAEDKRKKAGRSNVSFLLMDACKMDFRDEAFDAVFSRRGPATSSTESLKECCRVLKNRGLFAEITIGEKDCRELGNIFGRCQAMEIERPVLPAKSGMLKDAGFSGVKAEEFVYKDRFATVEDLLMLLETTPVIPDFDREKDRIAVKKLAEVLGKENLELVRHRVLLTGKKLVSI